MRSRKLLAGPSNRWTTPCSGFAAKWRGSFNPAISATAERNIFHLKERVKSCTKTRLWFARSAVRSSCSPPVSRSSMLSAASRTSPSAARLAVTLARTLPVAPVSSSPLPALVAAARRRFPSSPSPTVPCTAASASLRCAPTADC